MHRSLISRFASLTIVIAMIVATTSAASTRQQADPASQALREADSFLAQAGEYQKRSDNRRSLEASQQAVARFRSAGSRAGEARALSAVGSAYGRLSDYQNAIVSYSAALAIFRETADRKGEAAALTGIGAARVRLNEYDGARAVLEEALPLYRALGDRTGEATALQSIGYASFSQDDYPAAIEVYGRALGLARAAAARALEASIVYSLGQTYYHLGDYQRALDLYAEALTAHRAVANRSGEAAALSAIGRVYRFLGEHQKALDHHAQALALLRAIGERMNEATSLNNTGHVYLSMGRFAEARPYFEQSLAICLAVGNRSGEASNTNGLGLVLAGLGQFEQALPFHREALQLFRSLGHRRAEADSLAHIGRAYDGLGEFTQARRHLQEALAIYRAVGVPRQESETLYAMAKTAYRAGELAVANQDVDGAIRIAESFRQDVSSPRLRTSYQGTLLDFYELKIHVLMRTHARDASGDAAARALDASERARARSLLDLLAESRADIRSDVDAALLERERVLRQRLAGLAERQAQLAGGNTAGTHPSDLARDIERALAEHEDVLAKLRESSPRYAALMQPQPLDAVQIQSQLLDRDTLLLEYFLGAERSYVWAVSRDRVEAFELPRRDLIESAARRFHERLSANRDDEELRRAGAAVSELVLVPLAARLKGQRLVIVPDGALHYVPFTALPAPGGAAGAARPLIVDHEIVSLPSASTLAELRRETATRVHPSKLLAVVADPVFDAGDVRVRRVPASTAAVASAVDHAGLRRSMEQVAGDALRWPPPRLMGTRREARAILALVPKGKQREALDFEASRDVITTGALDGYQIVHFATHALINNEHPELSGLVLSLVDRAGRSRDGFLQLTDIYNLRLPADLVVLSACRTGLGPDMRGEGIVGLTRGFMYAGAPRVLTSYWQVDDAGTAALMERFYRALLDGSGRTPAAALRHAQVETLRQKDWQSPYYWAAFGLQGEWQSAYLRTLK